MIVNNEQAKAQKKIRKPTQPSKNAPLKSGTLWSFTYSRLVPIINDANGFPIGHRLPRDMVRGLAIVHRNTTIAKIMQRKPKDSIMTIGVVEGKEGISVDVAEGKVELEAPR